ncbi:hypothetical protein PDE_09776 [Penicillium oxalicum 114-2]|uniref:Uncharacterized protein n=1 Tax=Penicillium oxalicum (strain 114-2 / CGMCC 5302) TaxID=933388 RepID=S8BHV6_PENO1|nr:hypothetical protein PDE_09776 [Penicillium oxalicum 114-2]
MNLSQSISNASRSSAEYLSTEFSSVACEVGDPFAQLAVEVEQQPFTSNASLRNSLERRQRELQQDQTRDQYLVFTSIPLALFCRLSDDRSRTSKYCRFSYNTETGILIAKIVPNSAHEVAIRSFDSIITLELRAMNIRREIRPLGSTTVTVGNWKKEADCSWAIVSTRSKPSFVVEVGLSESARKLAQDAHGWLETDSSSVKLVVTINIKRDTPEIVLQKWELIPRRYGLLTRSFTLLAYPTASLKLTRTNNTTSVTAEPDMNTTYGTGTTAAITQLILPFEKIVGRPAQQGPERDFVIPESELKTFAEEIWSEQGLL